MVTIKFSEVDMEGTTYKAIWKGKGIAERGFCHLLSGVWF